MGADRFYIEAAVFKKPLGNQQRWQCWTGLASAAFAARSVSGALCFDMKQCFRSFFFGMASVY